MDFESITGRASIKAQAGKDTLEITLTTKPRREVLYSLLSFSFIFAVFFVEGKPLPFWAYLLCPITILWFWWIMRWQENLLFDRVRKDLQANP